MNLTEKIRYLARSIEKVTFKHDEAQAESHDSQWRHTLEKSATLLETLQGEEKHTDNEIERLTAEGAELTTKLQRAEEEVQASDTEVNACYDVIQTMDRVVKAATSYRKEWLANETMDSLNNAEDELFAAVETLAPVSGSHDPEHKD